MGALPPGPPPGGQPHGTPVIGQQFGPPFPEAGSAPAQTLVRGPDAKRGTLKNFDPL